MPKKKSVRNTAAAFSAAVDEIQRFVAATVSGATEEHASWVHDYAVIRLYREFEGLMLQALVGAINNDTETISARTEIKFPKHLTDEVCEFLIVGSGYFDFKGRDGLISLVKRFVPNDHHLLLLLKNDKYKKPLERLSALRNLAAHSSSSAKKRALLAVELSRMGSAGSWLKRQGRFGRLCATLKDLAHELKERGRLLGVGTGDRPFLRPETQSSPPILPVPARQPEFLGYHLGYHSPIFAPNSPTQVGVPWPSSETLATRPALDASCRP